MKKLLNVSFSKIYVVGVILISILMLGGYFSYAMFTVSKERSNAISIVTGNLDYELLIDGEESNTLTVPANSRQYFTITLNNLNNRIARFNFYYVGDIPDGVDIGYIEKDEFNTPPVETGINLEKVDTAGSSNTYIVRVANTTSSSITITLGVSVGLDYNDLVLPSDGHLLRKIISTGTVKEVIEDDIMNRLNYDDSEQTFVTGSNPYNYIWYSGKLWRVVSIDSSDNSVKLVTDRSISSILYDDNNSAFVGSYMEEWLNDTTVDGFLYNLREPENFIKMDSKWNVSQMSDTGKPQSEEEGGTIVEDAVGLLNIYEYTMSGASWLNNGYWWTLTPYSQNGIWCLNDATMTYVSLPIVYNLGVRPSINLKPEMKVVSGNGSEDNPYRLVGDNDSDLEGIKLNTRYSGEYITFGTGENNLYRIVSHETEGLTKITSDEPLEENGTFKTIAFGDTVYYSSTNTIGIFLNGNYLTSYVGNDYGNMIENNTTWYLGRVGSSASYRLAKYSDINMSNLTSDITTAKIGLLRLGELMMCPHNGSVDYWTLTVYAPNLFFVRSVRSDALSYAYSITSNFAIKPALNLKSNVIITSGDGTKNNPFQIALE